MNTPASLLLAAGALLLAACVGTSSEDAARHGAYVETRAVVKAVNPDRREVMLRTEGGRYLTVVAGREVRTFDQIDVGDTVRTGFVESVALSMSEAAAADAAEIEITAATVADDDEPAATIAREATLTVEIVSYDPDTAIATFTKPDGLTHSIVVDPALRDFASRRQPGERVEIHYTTAFAMLVATTS